MKKEEFNLSEKIENCIMSGEELPFIKVKDVKEFIRLLKKEIIGKQGISEQDYVEIVDGIDKIAGEKLS